MRRSFPFPLPNGWFRVAFEDETPRGSVTPLHYFGCDLVLLVAESGEAQVFDAHCPHLGAHLGHGGVAVGDSLRCPFHGWRFGMDGDCLEVPYAEKIPARARLRSWPTCRQNGVIWVWHHAAGDSPRWEVPQVPELGHPDWTPPLHRRWRVRTRNQEIAENTSDPAHFAVVHGFSGMRAPEIGFEGHRYRSRSRYGSPREDAEETESGLDVHWHGLGIGVTRSTGILELLFLGTLTPIDEDEVDACFSFSLCSAKGFDPERGIGQASIAESVRQMEQDIPIWENKCFRERPLLCEADGPIGLFRRWAGQFYTR